METRIPFLWLIVCLLVCEPFQPSFAQSAARPKPCALFYSANDYRAATATPQDHGAALGATQFDAIHLRAKSLVASVDKKHISVSKDSIFGYRLRNQKCYRWEVTSQRAFEILEQKAVVIYSAPEQQYSSKGYAMKSALYFSRTLDSPIRPLTAIEVKRAFPEAFALHHQLDLLPDPSIIARVDEATHSFILQQLIENHIPQH